MKIKKKQKFESSITGTIGDMNYTVKDCPFHLPKENAKFFQEMQKASKKSMISTYGNEYVPKSIFANSKKVNFT